MKDIKPYVGKAVIIPLLNGIEHFDILDNEFGKEKVFGGVAYVSTTLRDDGSIEHITSKASLKFGPRSKKILT